MFWLKPTIYAKHELPPQNRKIWVNL